MNEAEIRADERARLAYMLQRRVRIQNHVRETVFPDSTEHERSQEQGAFDLCGWFVDFVQQVNEYPDLMDAQVYKLAAPPWDGFLQPRKIERSIWKIEWR